MNITNNMPKLHNRKEILPCIYKVCTLRTSDVLKKSF